ncbi:hypothetical protein L6270_00950 [Candidatus Parcubacteria bacterium]|nr:hypothetical protein [Patescibacteria group bacterium]MBU4309716.1 hypothetical protein [Patescibacteria group bacterium]MBU4431660.1 hypothetical protein [Patescibacteria group bacterium]MBU4577896.1 hypothetical protein [Patescibacteria group bacterium]MCG2696594.1 hypothetical protein [Candidatus Parcubacteria bacterium]
MKRFQTRFKNKKVILALGADSSGGFAVFQNEQVYYQAGFGDLLNDDNFVKYSNSITAYLRKNKLKPELILVDLHPLFRSIKLGEKLAVKHQARLVKVQHHIAHIFSAYGEYLLDHKEEKEFIGMACDGTGFGFDEKIWGGEVFQLKIKNYELQFDRIAHLENQLLIGGEMAVIEPTRALIAILNNFLSKAEVFKSVKKYYSRNEFELLFNQLQERFNCVETSSTGRVLDAVAVLLGFVGNKSNFKHEPIRLLEENSTVPFDIDPEIFFDKNEQMFVVKTTPLFQYLIKNIQQDKKRLAATAQLYLAKGLFAVAKQEKKKIFFAGGMADNKIMSEYLETNDVFVNKQVSRGDEGLSWGQICYYLLND